MQRTHLIVFFAVLFAAAPVVAQDGEAPAPDSVDAPAVEPAPPATAEPAVEDDVVIPSPPATGVAVEDAAAEDVETAPEDEPSARRPGGEAQPPDPAPDLTAEEGFRLGDFRFFPQGQVRLRGEGRVDPYTAAGIGRDQWFVTTRLRLGLGAEWESVRILLQAQDARNLGDAPPGRDAGTTLHQGYLEVGEDGSFIRAGRQEINWGGQRILGALDWTSNARSFDAIRGVVRAQSSLTIEGFAAMVRSPWDFEVEELTGDPPMPTTRSVHSEGDYLAGLRGVWTVGDALTVDLYALYRHDGPNQVDMNRERDIVSPGLRLTGEPVEGLTYDLEGVVQVGRANGSEHLAFGAAGDVGYRFDHPIRPRVGVGGSYGSGQSPDGSVDELDNFFPTNHKFYGFADLFGWRNLVHGTATAAIAPADLPLTVRLDFHTFALAEPTGRWSNAGGATIGQSSAPGSSSLGQELDLTVGYRVVRGLSISGGYAVFFPNAGASRLGQTQPTHWMFLMVDAVAAP